jgi:hypothetical protein
MHKPTNIVFDLFDTLITIVHSYMYTHDEQLIEFIPALTFTDKGNL